MLSKLGSILSADFIFGNSYQVYFSVSEFNFECSLNVQSLVSVKHVSIFDVVIMSHSRISSNSSILVTRVAVIDGVLGCIGGRCGKMGKDL
jgi:hypothetical protein